MKSLLESVYRASVDRLPSLLRKTVSNLEHKAASLARVYYDEKIHPPERLRRGAVTVSIDFEMSWAWQYARGNTESPVSKGMREREQIPQLLEEFDRYQIPATWATVGHLFLSHCERDHRGLAHAALPRPTYFETDNWRFAAGDWFQHDPCTDFRHNPSWYAPDLIERILSSRVSHEIACHGFSHLGFGRYCSEDVASADLDACKAPMAAFGLKPTTFVFPGSDPGNLRVLAEKGVRIVRTFPKAHVHITLPVFLKEGMWGVPVSTTIESGRARHWSFEQRLARLMKFVDIAAATRLATHIWFHPSLPRIEMERILFPFLAYCDRQRELGRIDVLTMEQLVVATQRAGSFSNRNAS